MANHQQCSKCKKYHPLTKPKRSKEGGTIPLKKGHCLDRTVYASNRPGKEQYPRGAKMDELPHGQHKIVIVRETDIHPECLAFKER